MAEPQPSTGNGRQRLFEGDVDPVEWSSERAVRYEVAVEALNRAIGAATAQVYRAQEQGDQHEATRARAEAVELARRQRRLRVDDVQAVEAAIAHGYGHARATPPPSRGTPADLR